MLEMFEAYWLKKKFKKFIKVNFVLEIQVKHWTKQVLKCFKGSNDVFH